LPFVRRLARVSFLSSFFALLALPALGATNIAVLKSAASDVAPPGGNVTYTIAVQNLGLEAALNVQLLDPIPLFTTFVSLSYPGSWNCNTPSVGSTGNVVCTNASLAPGADQFTLVVKIDSDISPGTPFNNTASATADNDSDSSDNSATAQVVTAVSDLRILKTDNVDPVAADSDLAYTLSINNLQFLPAQNASWSDTLPAGTTFVSLEFLGGVEFNCTTPNVGTNGTVTCSKASFGGLGQGSSTYRLVVHVDPLVSVGTVLSNTATITSDTDDVNSGNNSATAETTVVASSANLSITKEANVTEASLAEPVTFTVTVTNNGPSVAHNVIVNDTLTGGLNYVSATPSQGSCNDANPIECNVGVLANGASATVTVVATVISSPVMNTATVDADESDPAIENNTAVVAVAVIEPIPALSPAALSLLAAMLASIALLVMRK